MSDRLLPFLGTTFFVGIALGHTAVYTHVVPFWFFCLGIALVCAGYLGRSHTVQHNIPVFFGVFFFVLGGATLYTGYVVSSGSSYDAYRGSVVEVTGVVAREPDVRTSMIHLAVRPVGFDSNELVAVHIPTIEYRTADITYGDLVVVRGRLTLPESFTTDSGRVFAYAAYYRARGITYLVADASLHVVAHESQTLMGDLFRMKQSFMETLEHILPEPHAGLGEGILLGVKRALGEDLETAFQRTGLTHIVVLSGYNIMIMVEFVWLLLSYGIRPWGRFGIALLIIIAFGAIVGFSATVVRASIMASILLLARTLDRPHHASRALWCAGILMVLHNPYILLYDPGFQLSFMATAGLVYYVSHVEAFFSRIPAQYGLRSIVATTCTAQCAVAPLLLYHIGSLSFISILVNILVIPIVPIAMLLTCITGVVGTISTTIGTFVGFSAYVTLSYIIFIAERFAVAPRFEVSAMPWWSVFVLYGGLLSVWAWIRTRSASTVVNDYADWVIEVDSETNSPDKS